MARGWGWGPMAMLISISYKSFVQPNPTSSITPLTFWFTSIATWLWLYSLAGFLLIASRRVQIGFDQFNAKFDIEKKPLQSIGLVAGGLAASVYWTAVVFSRITNLIPNAH